MQTDGKKGIVRKRQQAQTTRRVALHAFNDLSVIKHVGIKGVPKKRVDGPGKGTTVRKKIYMKIVKPQEEIS